MGRLLSALLVVFCASFSLLAQDKPDLFIQNFSAYSNITQADGNRLISASFRVVNFGPASAKFSVTRVTIGSSTVDFNMPILASGQVVFISHSLRTTEPQVNIDITADVNQQVDESNENNNTLHYVAQLASVEDNRWQSFGPTKIVHADGSTVGVGRVTTLAVDPTKPDVVYVGARDSGLWKTADGGRTWTPMTDSFPHPQIDSVAVDPAHPQRVLVASPDGVFESSNGGSVWTQITTQNLQPSGLDGAAFLVQNLPDQVLEARLASGALGPGGLRPIATLYLSSNLGLFVSRDAGRNWTLVLGEGNPNHLTPIGSLQFSTTDASHLFASLSTLSSNLGIFEAENGGLTASSWHKLQGCPNAPLPKIPGSSRVWVAESHGQKWMSFLSGGADGSVRQLFKSTDATCQVNGHTENAWVQVPIAADCDKLPKDNSSFLFLHPNNPSIVFKAGRFFCRSDSGDSPHRIPTVHDDQHSIAVVATAPSVMYLGNDGGIYRSDDSGASWRFVGEGLAVTEMLDLSLANTPVVRPVAGGWDNGAYTWTGPSPIWFYLEGTGDATSVAFDRQDASTKYEIDQGVRNLTRFTATAIDNIADANVLPDCSTGTEVGPGRSGEMAAPGGSPPVVVACNGLWSGPPWQHLNASAANTFSRVRLRAGGMWLAGTTDGRVFGGPDVTALTPLFTVPSGAKITALAFRTANTFYASSNSGQLFLLDCQNLAASPPCVSQDVASGLPPGEITALAVDPLAGDSILVAVRDVGIFRGAPPVLTTLARGIGTGGIFGGEWQWRLYSNGLPAGITVMDMETGHGLIVAATWGRGAFWLHSGPLPGGPLSVSGHITSFEAEPVEMPGHTHRPPQFLVTVELDSRPGWLFSASNLSGATRSRLQQAFQRHRLITLDFVPTGPTQGRITGAQ